MRRNAVVLIIMLSSLLMMNGCLSRGIKEGVGAVRGAKGAYFPVVLLTPNRAARPLGDYTHFELGEFTNTIGTNAPRGLWRHLPTQFNLQLIDYKLPNTPGKTLVLRGKILHYEAAAMTGHIFGPLEEVVARAEMVDKDSGRVLAEAIIVGRTKETVNEGADKKAAGLAKGLVAWIDSRYPEREED